MRINEKMGLVYTALFFTVSVAVITQNSDMLMAMFRGESSVQAVDDIFTVRAGRDQRLFVLKNDPHSNHVADVAVHLIASPACGTVEKSGAGFIYRESINCTGHQKFAYCIDTGTVCEPASVALRVIDSRNPVDTIAAGPAVEVTGLSGQVEKNSTDLEITNVHLGNTAKVETTTVPKEGTKLAKIAVESNASFVRPEKIAKISAVNGQFSMKTPDTFSAQGTTVAEVIGQTGTLTDQSPVASSLTLSLPVDPVMRRVESLALLSNGTPVRRNIATDIGFSAPHVMKGIDESPFGTKCSVALKTQAAPGGLVELSLDAPCLPNTRVEIRHGRLAIAVQTGHSGRLSEIIPAFETAALFSVTLPDGRVLKSRITVPDLGTIDRIAVQWAGDFDIGLHALEFGSIADATSDNWSGQSGAGGGSRAYEPGYTVRLGDSNVQNPMQAEIYTLSRTRKTPSGAVELSVQATPGDQTCGQAEILRSFRSHAGHLIGASGLQFKLPACDETAQSLVLKNALRDLIIAAK